jgi:2-polyprenyl-3-methyl-5-hydroxy-6-metoxy-1,4-benzoquinol methylase
MKDALQALQSLNQEKGAGAPVEQFHQQINVIFHDVESEVYDRIHCGMWRSLPQEFSRLIRCSPRDVLTGSGTLRLLDIGCGTGLGTSLLLRTRLGQRIRDITLLDTSPQMLTASARRFRHQSVFVRTVTGRVEDLLQANDRFDVVLSCSVLHHIPDLPSFLEAVSSLQSPRGFFLHLQDPNADANHTILQKRKDELRQRRVRPSAIGKCRALEKRIQLGVRRRLNRALGQPTAGYMERVNEILIQRSVISRPLTDEEIWMVTDIHERPGDGVSVSAMRHWMKDYELVSWHSYAFFGELWSELPRDLRHREEQLASSGDCDGATIAGVWKKAAASGTHEP